MTVVDASVLVPALIDGGRAGEQARAALTGRVLSAPEILDLECASLLRRQVAAGVLDRSRARAALDDLTDLPLLRAPHRPLLARCWELLDNGTVYDAAYVGPAEVFAVPCSLPVADWRVRRSRGAPSSCSVERVLHR